MPIVDACSGTSCKFLQTAARPGAISHERRRPVVPGSRVQTAGTQPTLSATMAAGGVSGSAVTCCVPSRLLRLDSIRRCIPPFWRVLGGTRPGFDLRSTSNRDFGGEATMPSDAAMHSSRHAEREGRSGDHIARRDRLRPVRWPSKLSPDQRRRGCSPARVMPQADQAIVGWFG